LRTFLRAYPDLFVSRILANAHLTFFQATKAGIIVAKQKANPNKDIATLASEIVLKWKKTIEGEKRNKTSAAKNGVSSPAPATPATPASMEPKGFVGDASKRKWETDKVDTKRTGIPTRDSCIGLIYNGLAFRSEESPTHVIIKAIEVEKAAYDHFKGDNPEYRAKIRSLFQNLKSPTNQQLGIRVMSGDITPGIFVTMPQEALKSDTRRKEDEKLAVENMKKAQVPMAEKSISDVFKCAKCGQKKVSYSQAQTRSADEPMTTFCTCTVCGNRWKVSAFCLWIIFSVIINLSIVLLDFHCTKIKISLRMVFNGWFGGVQELL